MNHSLVILGAGGHAKVLIDTLQLRKAKLIGLTDADAGKCGCLVLGVPVLGNDDIVKSYPVTTIKLVNGLGSVRVSHFRKVLFERFKCQQYEFAEVVHPSAIIASDVKLSEGVQIMAGSIVQTSCFVGKNVLINTAASVDHDCIIGDHVHLAPGVVLSGSIVVGENSHIGTGAKIIQGVQVGRNCLVAAGAVVVRDVPDGATVAGVPAKEIKI